MTGCLGDFLTAIELFQIENGISPDIKDQHMLKAYYISVSIITYMYGGLRVIITVSMVRACLRLGRNDESARLLFVSRA
jgi:hypothetical protein